MADPLHIPHLTGRERPLLELGFSPPNAVWITLVCFHSGVFTRRQYADLNQCHRVYAHRLVHRLTNAGLAREHLVPDTSLQITHIHARALYRALQIENVRHRRKALPLVLLRRLLSLDHVAEHPHLPWLPTEPDKLAYFDGRGIPRHDLPQRTYAGALNNTRRYFPLKLPVAADDHTATFLYTDPGRDSRTELRTWADSHSRLWTRLRNAGTSIHVAIASRDPLAHDAYAPTLDAWLSATPSEHALTAAERSTLSRVEAALVSPDPNALLPWGGLAEARTTALRLRKRADNPSSTPPRSIRIDSFSTHTADRLSPDSLIP